MNHIKHIYRAFLSLITIGFYISMIIFAGIIDIQQSKQIKSSEFCKDTGKEYIKYWMRIEIIGFSTNMLVLLLSLVF